MNAPPTGSPDGPATAAAPAREVVAWRWRLPRERRVTPRAPVAHGDAVFAAFHYERGAVGASTLVCLDAATGRARWTWNCARILNVPAVGPDGTAYVTVFSGEVCALAPEDGREVWRTRTGGPSPWVPVLAGERAGRLVFAELGNTSRTWCLDARTGGMLWTTRTGGHAYALAAVDGRVVHATAPEGSSFDPGGPGPAALHGLDLASGRPLWRAESEEYLFATALPPGRGVALVGARGSVRSYDAATGAPLAVLPLPDRAAAADPPLLRGTDLFVGDDTGTLRRVDAARPTEALAEAWAVRHRPSRLAGRPAAVGPRHVAALWAADGHLALLDAATGREEAAWVLRVEGTAPGGPLALTGAGGVVAVGGLLVASCGREVSAVRLPPGVGRA